MQVNRLGKKINDLGYRSMRDFIETNNIKIEQTVLHRWCTKGSTPNSVYSAEIDKLAGILDCSRIEVLNMIASKPSFDVKSGRELPKREDGNLLKQKRYDLKLTSAELAELIGIGDRQVIVDIENGKRAKFPVGKEEAFKNYLDALDISFTQFQKAVAEIKDKRRQMMWADRLGNSISEEATVIPAEEVKEEPDVKVKDIVNVTVTDEEFEVFKEAMSKPIPLTACDPSEYPSVPCKAPSLPLDTEKINTVMSLIYGHVDYEVYKEVENILKGVI